jgi:hypothetical protein
MEGVRAVGAQILGTRRGVVPPGFDRHLLSTLLLAGAKPTQIAAMNGTEPQIEIFKPFGEAFELMKKILFQPFDLKKWFVISFAAFLCGHYSAGGFGFNFPSSPGKFSANRVDRNFAVPDFSQFHPWFAIVIGLIMLLILVIILVLTWLRARGNFIFVDCIIRDRPAIAAPWREYRNEGNSYFLFSIAVVFAAVVLVSPHWCG